MEYADNTILIGIHGPRGSGKTTLASELAPPARMGDDGAFSWAHLNFAMPLREMWQVKEMTAGFKAEDRILYQIHEVLLEVLGGNPLFGAPSYDDLVQLVYQVAEHKTPTPKRFMQFFGQMFREEFGQDVWVEWLARKAREESSLLGEDGTAIVVISDVRHENEMKYVESAPHSLLVKLSIESNILLDRLIDRDGRLPSREEGSHVSEIFKPSDDMFDLVLDTSYNSPTELAQVVRSLVQSRYGA